MEVPKLNLKNLKVETMLSMSFLKLSSSALTSEYFALLPVYFAVLLVERNQQIRGQNHPTPMLLSLLVAALLERSLLLDPVLSLILTLMLVPMSAPLLVQYSLPPKLLQETSLVFHPFFEQAQAVINLGLMDQMTDSFLT